MENLALRFNMLLKQQLNPNLLFTKKQNTSGNKVGCSVLARKQDESFKKGTFCIFLCALFVFI